MPPIVIINPTGSNALQEAICEGGICSICCQDGVQLL
eukprot:CAMPEP_0115634564 /NCGR_PEP_ID=MMETSP0272-20121206/32650_1 /TAXON_ID=71861 /ORGANISM="Scrippsiella trochoidea, Strain CCMP3099" /LENGTH=36 /DNA_ID= /DNA_START= /DNA_END= /DNA_ORIENTATION=